MQGAIAGSFSEFSPVGDALAFLLWHSSQPSQPKGQPTKTWPTLIEHINFMTQHL
jgi:hypothetical protein